MNRGKLIVFEGNDASGKETHTKKVVERLNYEGIPSTLGTFPMYDTPSGRIIAGPVLGKRGEFGDSYFANPAKEDSRAISAYYAADRRFALPLMKSILNSGTNLILDRYVGSNMAHQGGKLSKLEERHLLFQDLDYLEHEFMKIPRPDFTVFLYVPFEVGIDLKSKMNVQKDRVEEDKEYLMNSERTYLELADLFNWNKIDLSENGKMRSIEDNHELVYKTVKDFLI